MKSISCILIAVCLIAIGGCSSLFFYPRKECIYDPLLTAYSYEEVYFKTSDDVKLHGWHLKATPKRLGTILYLHGNADNICTSINSVLWLSAEGYDVFAFDYRGYGKSEGSPSLEGVHLDAQAALETVLSIPGMKKENIFVLGQSLGGAIAVYTVATSLHKNRIKALVIDSAFSGYRLIAREKLAKFILTWPFQYPLSLLFSDRYSPIRRINEVFPVPLLIMHGDKDRIVPEHHAVILYEKALNPKDFWLVKDVGHIQAFGPKEIREDFLRYMRSIVQKESQMQPQ